ncbi:hypothetical protein [Vibrio parahaemolyticus]|uniref:hypothetical protein n=1 Tax=Vibrio parahaemolyticus TaxID=670 RepID=UPI0015B85B79|nr:hypothetical protein [Vibrio parahaemolyticus]QLE24609.1 hypothetical protein FDP11_02820 [Vibrio parahaemolyticus]
MSMSLLVVRFDKKNSRLNANYNTESKKVYVNEFINDYIDEDFLSEFKVYEDDEVYFYREINVDELFIKLESSLKDEKYSCSNINKLTRIQEVKDIAQEMVLINELNLLCSRYYQLKTSSRDEVKLITA